MMSLLKHWRAFVIGFDISPFFDQTEPALGKTRLAELSLKGSATDVTTERWPGILDYFGGFGVVRITFAQYHWFMTSDKADRTGKTVYLGYVRYVTDTGSTQVGPLEMSWEGRHLSIEAPLPLREDPPYKRFEDGREWKVLANGANPLFNGEWVLPALAPRLRSLRRVA